jgi:hypothetical protein
MTELAEVERHVGPGAITVVIQVQGRAWRPCASACAVQAVRIQPAGLREGAGIDPEPLRGVVLAAVGGDPDGAPASVLRYNSASIATLPTPYSPNAARGSSSVTGTRAAGPCSQIEPQCTNNGRAAHNATISC